VNREIEEEDLFVERNSFLNNNQRRVNVQDHEFESLENIPIDLNVKF